MGGEGDEDVVEDVGSACAIPIPSPTALKPRLPDTTAMATSCLSFIAHLLVSFALAFGDCYRRVSLSCDNVVTPRAEFERIEQRSRW